MIVIGEGYLDLYLDLEMVKPGGVFHYAHVLEALKIKSKIYHLTPDYLHGYLERLPYKHVNIYSIGNIANTPNIITINESKEIGDQKYRNILDNLKETNVFTNEINMIENKTGGDLFILPGSYDILLFKDFLAKFNGKKFIDIAYDITIEKLTELNCRFSIIFISTSSEIFLNQFSGDFNKCKNWIIPKYADILVLKENRGGSRIFTQSDTFFISAQISRAAHSVGVGDCYNIAFISEFFKSDFLWSGKYASKVASIYGQSTKLHEFQSRIKKLSTDDCLIEGVSLPWEERKKNIIYIAAPDFKKNDTKIIDDICKKLEYHNFNPVRPIKVCGEIDPDTPPKEIRRIIKKDIDLIYKAKIILAIILSKDEGTIAEIGYASALGKPVIIHDPFKLIENAFVENIAIKITYSLEDLINAVYFSMSYN